MSPRNEEEVSPRLDVSAKELEPSAPVSLAPPIEDPPSPGGFAESIPPTSPKYTIPDLGGFDEPNLPKSPSFGDEFGGFSSFGDGDDPWGNRQKEHGWTGSSGHHSRGSPEIVEMQSEGSIEGDEWGGSRSVHVPQEPVAQSGMDQDWQAAQKRIRVTEERAVSSPTLSTSQTSDEVAPRKGHTPARGLARPCRRRHRRQQAGRPAKGRGGSR